MVRKHTVTAAGAGVVRVLCDYCGSQHNYRGGGPAPRSTPARGGVQAAPPPPAEPFPLVSERERSASSMEDSNPPVATQDLETMLRRVIREESGLTGVVPAAKWRDGRLILKPGNEELQDRVWPIETFFHKIVMLRNRLRTLEQQLNSSDVPESAKVKMQSYITACYGSLTSFNVLFAEDEDRFRGAGGS
jgi:hypothetical protein